MIRLNNVNYSYLTVMNRLFVGLFGSRSCGVARSIIAGFHPVDPGSNPGTSTIRDAARHICSFLDLFLQKIIAFITDKSVVFVNLRIVN